MWDSLDAVESCFLTWPKACRKLTRVCLFELLSHPHNPQRHSTHHNSFIPTRYQAEVPQRSPCACTKLVPAHDLLTLLFAVAYGPLAPQLDAIFQLSPLQCSKQQAARWSGMEVCGRGAPSTHSEVVAARGSVTVELVCADGGAHVSYLF